MGVFLRSTWFPSDGEDALERAQSVSNLVLGPLAELCPDGRWYRTAHSRSAALSVPVLDDPFELSGRTRLGAKGSLPHPEPELSMSLWNGADGLASVSLSVRLGMAPAVANRLLVSRINERRLAFVAEKVASQVAMRTQGVTVVSANELIDWAEGEGLSCPHDAAIAVHWLSHSPPAPHTGASWDATSGLASVASCSMAQWVDQGACKAQAVQSVISVVQQLAS